MGFYEEIFCLECSSDYDSYAGGIGSGTGFFSEGGYESGNYDFFIDDEIDGSENGTGTGFGGGSGDGGSCWNGYGFVS